MATLEIHDGQGRVQRVTITREQTVLFGSSPKCEIVLDGEGVLPFHGRLRWKKNRYKADASPDAGAIEVNGKRLASSSFRQGDEIVVGPCRIYMIHSDEDLPRDDKTRIQATPFVTTQTTAPAKPRSRSRSQVELERDDWFQDLEVAPPSGELEILPEDTPRPSGRRGRDRTRTARGSKAAQWSFRGLYDRFFSTQVAPGEERVLTSPLVFGLVIAVVVLIGLGFSLNTIIARTVTTRLFHRAVESFDDGDDRNAIRRFDEYLARKSGDGSRDSKARVLRALANVRQFTTSTGASWSNALTAEREMLDQVSDEPAYRDSSTELAELVLKTGESLADRARLTADAKTLSEAEAAQALHARVKGSASGALLVRSKLPAKLDAARAAVRKGAIRSQSLAAMDTAIQAGSAGDAYKARDVLVRQYADLAGDRELIARMTRANALIQRAVTFDSSRRPAETEPHPEPLGPPTTVVLRSKKSDAPSGAATSGLPVFALADGFAYGISSDSGTPLWQVPVGLSSPFAPLAIPGGTTVLVFDARHDELVRLDARTGKLIWRQALGTPIQDPPLVLGNQVIQAAPDGNVYLLDLMSGELRTTYRLGLPLTRTPVSDESGQYLYVLANQDCLFVLKRDPVSCEAVEYLGHAAGSLPCPPARLGRFLVIPENQGLNEGRWRVCILDDDGAKVRQGQQIAVPGWTWSTPAASGSVIWATSDRAGVAAYAIGDYSEKAPFRLISQFTADAQPSGPAFAFARTEREIWLSGARPGRYDLSIDKGALDKVWSLTGVGPALAPIQVAGSNQVILTHQYLERPGVSVWGVDPRTGAVHWQTVLGSAWPLALQSSPQSEDLETLGMDGQRLKITASQLKAGGFVESPLPRPGSFRLPTGVEHRLEGEGMTILVPEPHARQLLVSREGGAFQAIDLPVALGANPLLWGSNVLIPGDDGRAYLIDPHSGESRAEPFVPPFDRTHATSWRSPARLDEDAVVLVDDAGKVRRLTVVSDPRPRLVASAEVALGAGLLADPASTGSAIILAVSDGRIRALAARDLSPVGAWPMESALARFPTSLGSLVFATELGGGVSAFGADGQRIWSTKLRGTFAASAPAIQNDSAWILAQDGSLHRFALSDGAPLDRIDLNLLPAGDLRTNGPDLVVPVARGTVRALSLPNPESKESGGKPSTSP